jgi:hypothetical protein
MGGSGLLCTCSSTPLSMGPEISLMALVHKTTYDLYSPVHNVLDACISITGTCASGRGLGPGILDFFWPQMAFAYRLDAIS